MDALAYAHIKGGGFKSSPKLLMGDLFSHANFVAF
jgi:hypothetical protein